MSPIQFDSIDNFKSHVEKQSNEKLVKNEKQIEQEQRLAEQQRAREQKLQAQKEQAEKERLEREQMQREQAENQRKADESNGNDASKTDDEPDAHDAVQSEENVSIGGNIDDKREDSKEDTRNLDRVPRVDPGPTRSASTYSEDMFGGLMYYGEDLSYHMNDISKQMRPYLSEALFRGAKSYLTYTKGAMIDRMTQGQFLAYLLIGAFPPEIRNVIINEMPSGSANDIVVMQLKEDIARESSPASLVNIANTVQEISDQMRLMLDADLSRDERMSVYLPAILYASTWLLTDRMDLREKVSPRLSFNEYLNGEQTVPPNTDSVIRAGEGLQRRLDAKNNEARSGNIFGTNRKRK